MHIANIFFSLSLTFGFVLFFAVLKMMSFKKFFLILRWSDSCVSVFSYSLSSVATLLFPPKSLIAVTYKPVMEYTWMIFDLLLHSSLGLLIKQSVLFLPQNWNVVLIICKVPIYNWVMGDSWVILLDAIIAPLRIYPLEIADEVIQRHGLSMFIAA